MKNIAVALLVLFISIPVFSQTDKQAYTIQFYDPEGNALSGPSYFGLSTTSSTQDILHERLPDPSSSDYSSFEWHFIPVGEDEPRVYYIQNKNGQYLYASTITNFVSLTDEIGTDGFKWYLGHYEKPAKGRKNQYLVRLFTTYGKTNYNAYRGNTKTLVSIKSSVTTSRPYIFIKPSRDIDNLVYNGNLELITEYKKITSTTVFPEKPTINSMICPENTDCPYFPVDFQKETGEDRGSVRLIHNQESSGVDGSYFIRMKQGGRLLKTIDNSAINGLTHFQIKIKTRATKAGKDIALLTIYDSSGNSYTHLLETKMASNEDLENPDAWHTNDFYLSIKKLNATALMKIELLMAEDDILDVDDISIYEIDRLPGEIIDLYWSPKDNNEKNNWQSEDNWIRDNNKRGYIPDKETNVILQENQMAYPILKNEENLCRIITFENGSQLGNTYFLDYDSVRIRHTINTMQWYGMAAPLKNMYSGDYLFEQVNPLTEMRHFVIEEAETGFLYSDWSTPFISTVEPLDVGKSYSVRVGKVYYPNLDENGAQTNDKQLIDEVAFTFPNSKETFLFYDEMTKLPTGEKETIPQEGRKWRHRFIYEIEKDGKSIVPESEELLSLSFPHIVGENSLMIGNPFMSNFNFEAFYKANKELIYPEFKLLVDGNEYLTYSGIDVDLDGIIDSASTINEDINLNSIQSMTSFVVTTRENFDENSLVINKDMSSILGYSYSNGIRNEESRLSIEVSQDNSKSKCLILFSDDYNNEYLSQEDARRMIVKNTSNKAVIFTISNDKYLEINRLQTITDTLQIGITSVKQGKNKLSFQDINTIDFTDELYFLDLKENVEIPFAGKNLFNYEFYNTEDNIFNRFYLIRKDPANINDVSNEFFVRIINNELFIKTNDTNPVHSVEIFNLNGIRIWQEYNIQSSYYKTILSDHYPPFLILKIHSERQTKVQKLNQ